MAELEIGGPGRIGGPTEGVPALVVLADGSVITTRLVPHDSAVVFVEGKPRKFERRGITQRDMNWNGGRGWTMRIRVVDDVWFEKGSDPLGKETGGLSDDEIVACSELADVIWDTAMEAGLKIDEWGERPMEVQSERD